MRSTTRLADRSSGRWHRFGHTAVIVLADRGALAGVVQFLVWLWLSNIAILFGAALDTERA